MTTTSPSSSSTTQKLPVIIAGAGPCGLVAALTLQRHNAQVAKNNADSSTKGQQQEQEQVIPFVLIERASPSKLCANVGSGYDLAPAAITILQDRLGLDIDQSFHKYTGMVICDQDANTVRSLDFSSSGYDSYMADRSVMQSLLLDSLLKDSDSGDDWKKAAQKESSASKFFTSDGQGILQCGVTVTGYKESSDSVRVELDDGTEIVGSVLLGCDGIRSKVRGFLMQGGSGKDIQNDEFHFCKTHCWWGKAEIPPGSEVESIVKKTQCQDGMSFVWSVGTKRSPGAFVGAPREGSAKVFLWSLFKPADAPPASSNDLTRRGGSVLTEEQKSTLLQDSSTYGELVTELVRATPAAAITHVGLSDRQRLDLPWSSESGRIALLGDAAHPQSPFAGQGVNMAINDAYVLATRITMITTPSSKIPDAVRAYDSDYRRQGVNRIIRAARSRTDLSLSTSRFVNWFSRMYFKFAPASVFLNEAVDFDRSNAESLANIDKEISVTASSQ